jgi:hypothetical protein
MSERRWTCFGCAHLGLQKIAMGGSVAYCKKTKGVVPQHFQSSPPQITYWRVPGECPLPDDQVYKNNEKAPQKEWITEKLSA